MSLRIRRVVTGHDAGGKAVMAPGDVGDADDAPRMVRQAVADLGRLDLLFANAGTPGTRRRIAPPELDLITEDLWQQLLAVNLIGVFRCAKAAAPAARRPLGSTRHAPASGRWNGARDRLRCDDRGVVVRLDPGDRDDAVLLAGEEDVRHRRRDDGG